jgi:cytochrome c-type biogenesis protein CcmF
VLLGTIYPLILDTLGQGTVSVGPPYYNATFMPIILPLIALTAIGPLLSWKRADLPGALGRLKFALAIAIIAALIAWWIHGGPALALLGVALAAWLFVGALTELIGRSRALSPGGLGRLRRLPRAAWGMTLAHGGIALAILGMTGSAAWKQEDIRVLRPGESAAIAGYSYRLDQVFPVPGPNYEATRARFTVSVLGNAEGSKPVAVLYPEKRSYPVAETTTTQAAIRMLGLADLYGVIGEPDGKGGWAVRFYYEPLVPLIWIGCLIMAAGGIVSLSDRRYRVGAPQRAAARAKTVPAE